MGGRLAGKVALIVGAARGIGAGIAERFNEEGARLVIADRDAAAGAATAERLEAAFVATDIAQLADAERAVETALATYGDLHIVVQNAGIYPWSLIETISPEEWDLVLGVNLRGTFLIARAALPHMKAKRYGRFVFTSSITGPPRHQSGPWPLFRLQGRHQRLHQVGGAGVFWLQYHGQRRGAGQHHHRGPAGESQRSLHPLHGGDDPARPSGYAARCCASSALPRFGRGRLYHRDDHPCRWRADSSEGKDFRLEPG